MTQRSVVRFQDGILGPVAIIRVGQLIPDGASLSFLGANIPDLFLLGEKASKMVRIFLKMRGGYHFRPDLLYFL